MTEKRAQEVHAVAEGGKLVCVMLSAASAGEQQPGRGFEAAQGGQQNLRVCPTARI